jgi:hypothetical protein
MGDNPLVGVWRIVAFQFEGDDGKRHNIYYDHPTGFLYLPRGGQVGP